MKLAWIVSLVVLVSTPTLAAVISPTEAASHVGEHATVEGVVSEVHTARSGKATFIDMGGRYPNNAFTAVIFERSMSAVGDVSGLEGKTGDVSGTITLYRGKPEIIVTARDQIGVK